MVRKGFPGHIDAIRTHIDETKPGAAAGVTWGSRPNFGYLATNALFSRDCLEVDITIGQYTLCVLGNHFKAQDGKPASNERRRIQADRVAELFDSARKNKLPVVMGDLNADVGSGSDAGKSLNGLLSASGLVDPFGGIEDNWTHFYDSASEVSRLDYILLDERLTFGSQEINRKGLSKRCKQYIGERFPTVSFQHTEASDHCLICVEIDV